MNAPIKIVLKTDYVKNDGTVHVRLRLTINQKVKYYPLHVFVKPQHFKSGRINNSNTVTKSLKPNKANVLRYFLFCCYTCVRYSDVANLRYSNIIDGTYISLVMIKTKEHVIIPLSEKAKELLPTPDFKAQHVF